MNILTYKVKHKQDLEKDLENAYKIALYAKTQQGNKLPTTKDTKHFGIKSEISNQILRKYHSQKKLKTIKKDKVKLTIPGRAVKVNQALKTLTITPMKLSLDCWFEFDFNKINQIELDKEYAYISVSLEDEPIQEANKWIGIDLNSTSHVIVTANQETGNVKKYGKQIPFLKKVYKNLRRKNQRKGAYKLAKKQSKREQNKTKDILQKITTKITKEAKKTNCGIKLENLKGISKKNTKKYHKEQNYTLNSWPFYQFRKMIEYKSLLLGIKLEVVNPKNTSQNCSKCKIKGIRERKLFNCPNCGHLEHADTNAAFNIALCLGSNLGKNDMEKSKTFPEVIKTEELTLREGNSKGSIETLEPQHL